MSNRNRLKASLDDTKNYRQQMRFRFQANSDAEERKYTYSDKLHLMVLSVYTQASVQNKDQRITLVDRKLEAKDYKLSIMELQTLLDKCDRALRKMEIARTKVDEEEAV